MAKRKKPEDPSSENSENFSDSSDDTFGLPEIEYEPIKRDEEEPKQETPQESQAVEELQPVEPEPAETSYQQEEHKYDYSYHEEKASPVWPKALLIVLIIVVLVGGGLWLFLKYLPDKKEAETRASLELAKRNAREKRDLAIQDSLKQVEARNRRIADSLAQANATPTPGTIEQLTERTRRYYVVIASAIDDDLIMDHAQRLSAGGASPKIIPPFGKSKFYRLAVDVADTFADAQTKADELKATYGDAVWVLRY